MASPITAREVLAALAGAGASAMVLGVAMFPAKGSIPLLMCAVAGMVAFTSGFSRAVRGWTAMQVPPEDAAYMAGLRDGSRASKPGGR